MIRLRKLHCPRLISFVVTRLSKSSKLLKSPSAKALMTAPAAILPPDTEVISLTCFSSPSSTNLR